MDPDPEIHPIVVNIKSLISQINKNYWSKKSPIFAYYDLHAHSRKKCVFLYGPHYPLHDDRYFKVRLSAKILSERTQMFRFF